MKKHYHKYCKHLTYLIISSSLTLFSTGTFAQESQSFTITPELSKQVVEKYNLEDFKIYPVISKEIEKASELSGQPSKKLIYVASEPLIELSVLSGSFTELPEKYMLITDEVAGKFVKNELITESNEHFVNDHGFRGLPIFKKSDTNELYYITSWNFIAQLETELNQIAYKTLGTNAEYKTWKTKYLGLLQSAQVNVNACNAIIAKHTYLNRIGQKRYDTSTFTKSEKITFNKNLDALNDKLSQIGELEANRDYLQYYNDKASTKEAAESYSLSSYYNSTSKAY